MTSQIHFFPVGNGDMTLIQTTAGKSLLIDCNIRKAADDANDDTFDAATELKGLLERDENDRLYVDAMLLSHPDTDHILGFETHFHVGDPEHWSVDDDKIIIRELLSSPIVFRRLQAGETLCSDAKVFETEAKRRVKIAKDGGDSSKAGNRIKILGEDIDGKTEDIADHVIKIGETFSELAGESAGFEALLIAPLPDDEVGDDESEKLSKNNSSVILKLSIAVDDSDDPVKFLTGGDAEVEVWDQVWERHKDRSEDLDYDLLQAPHHCSWRSLSHESWSDTDGKAELSDPAYNALSQALDGAVVVSSSKPIKDDKDNPPCIGAKDIYEDIDAVSDFFCTGEYPSESSPGRLTLELSKDGLKPLTLKASAGRAAVGVGSTASKSRSHG